MLLSSTTVNGAVSNDSNNNITMSVGNTVIANVNSSGIFFESGKKAIYTGATLQVVQTAKTDSFSTTSGSYVTLLTVSITPSSTSNKVLITYGINGGTNGDTMHGYVAIFRNSTQLFQADASGSKRSATSVINTATQVQQYYGGTFLDSPSTTSAITYTIQVLSSNGQTLYINRSARDNDAIAYDGRSVSSLTVMEIAG